MKIMSRLLLFVAALCMAVSAHAFEFAASSPFSAGRWVKVEVPATGIYRIPYSQLRDMGFENPAAVGVYGYGGRMLPVNFYNPAGAVYSDALEQVAVVHDADNLVFYAQSGADVSFNTGRNCFARKSRNIYTDSGFYFLSDAAAPLPALKGESIAAGATELKGGVGYIYHEQDLYQSQHKSGQVYWGEDLETTRVQSGEAHLPAAGSGMFECALFMNPKSTYSIQVEVEGEPFTHAGSVSASALISPQSVVRPVSITGNAPLSFNISGKESDVEFMHLDYAVLSYPKRIVSAPSEIMKGGERYGFATEPGRSYLLSLPQGVVAYDITDPRALKVCARSGEDASEVVVQSDGYGVELCLVGADASYSLASDAVKIVANRRNLHSLAATGIDYLIISAPAYTGQAEKIAALHQKQDGMNTLVVTPEELYDEFSAGIPDPMAYRAFAKMLHQDGGRLRNVLLLGPVAGDFRSFTEREGYGAGIIGYQERDLRYDREPNMVCDLYGIMQDKVDEAILYRCRIDVPVGVLTVRSQREADRVVSKIEEYMGSTDLSGYGNEFMFIGGVGDTHIHDRQAIRFAERVSTLSADKNLATVFSVDAYGHKKGRELIFNRLDRGNNITFYTGHGGSYLFGQTIEFIGSADICALRNRNLGFIFLSGCDFSFPDKGLRGIGEMVVLDAPRGMVGSICSTRTTWSNQNAEQTDRFLNRLFTSGNYTTAPTIGELFSAARSISTYPNSLTYILCSDPALKLPYVNRKVVVESAPDSLRMRKRVLVRGYVAGADGELDKNYDGFVTIKLLAPKRTLISADHVSNTITADRDTLRVPYNCERIAAFKGKVSGGRFEVPIILPQEAENYVYQSGELLGVNIATFSPANWEMGSETCRIPYSAAPPVPSNAPEDEHDFTPPVVNVAYLPERGLLEVEVADNGYLPASGAGVLAMVGDESLMLYPFERMDDGAVATSLRMYADVSHLPAGKHSVELTAIDLAGNVIIISKVINISTGSGGLRVVLPRKTVQTELEYEIAGNDASGPFEMTVMNESGEIVVSAQVNAPSGTIRLDGKDGVPLPDGLYRVAARSAGGDSRILFSEWTHFAVMQ